MDEKIFSFHRKTVRDLVWVLHSPTLVTDAATLRYSNTCKHEDVSTCSSALPMTESWCESLVSESWPWFVELDKDPKDALGRYLDQCFQSKRNKAPLGFYFSFLMEFFIRNNPVLNAGDIHTSMQVREVETSRTLGALKFVFRTPFNGQVHSNNPSQLPALVHLEASVKYFCYLPDEIIRGVSFPDCQHVASVGKAQEVAANHALTDCSIDSSTEDTRTTSSTCDSSGTNGYLGETEYLTKTATSTSRTSIISSATCECGYKRSLKNFVGPHLAETMQNRLTQARNKLTLASHATNWFEREFNVVEPNVAICWLKGYTFFPLELWLSWLPKVDDDTGQTEYHQGNGVQHGLRCLLSHGSASLSLMNPNHGHCWYTSLGNLSRTLEKLSDANVLRAILALKFPSANRNEPNGFLKDQNLNVLWTMLPKVHWLSMAKSDPKDGTHPPCISSFPTLETEKVPLVTLQLVLESIQNYFSTTEESRIRPVMLSMFVKGVSELGLDSSRWYEVSRGFVLRWSAPSLAKVTSATKEMLEPQLVASNELNSSEIEKVKVVSLLATSEQEGLKQELSECEDCATLTFAPWVSEEQLDQAKQCSTRNGTCNQVTIKSLYGIHVTHAVDDIPQQVCSLFSTSMKGAIEVGLVHEYHVTCVRVNNIVSVECLEAMRIDIAAKVLACARAAPKDSRSESLDGTHARLQLLWQLVCGRIQQLGCELATTNQAECLLAQAFTVTSQSNVLVKPTHKLIHGCLQSKVHDLEDVLEIGMKQQIARSAERILRNHSKVDSELFCVLLDQLELFGAAKYLSCFAENRSGGNSIALTTMLQTVCVKRNSFDLERLLQLCLSVMVTSLLQSGQTTTQSENGDVITDSDDDRGKTNFRDLIRLSCWTLLMIPSRRRANKLLKYYHSLPDKVKHVPVLHYRSTEYRHIEDVIKLDWNSFASVEARDMEVVQMKAVEDGGEFVTKHLPNVNQPKTSVEVTMNRANKAVAAKVNDSDSLFKSTNQENIYKLTLVDNELDAMKACEYFDSLEHCEDVTVIGIDAEWRPFAMQTAQALPCSVLQLASTCGQVWLIDLVVIHTELRDESAWGRQVMEAVVRLFANQNVMLVGFGLEQDLTRVLETIAEFDLVSSVLVESVLDLQLVLPSYYLIETAPESLVSWLQQVCCISLDKSEQCSDWQDRPLTHSQLTYASLDAIANIRLFQSLYSELQTEQSSTEAIVRVNAWKREILLQVDKSTNVDVPAPSRCETELAFGTSVVVSELDQLGLKYQVIDALNVSSVGDTNDGMDCIVAKTIGFLFAPSNLLHPNSSKRLKVRSLVQLALERDSSVVKVLCAVPNDSRIDTQSVEQAMTTLTSTTSSTKQQSVEQAMTTLTSKTSSTKQQGTLVLCPEQHLIHMFGHSRGTIGPFGGKGPLYVLMDVSIRNATHVCFGSGSLKTKVLVSTSELFSKCTHIIWDSFANHLQYI